MAHALGVEREELLLGSLGRRGAGGLRGAASRRRLADEPVAYIIGRRAFWTIELEVGPGVLIPRPDSETLIEAAVAHFGDGGPGARSSISAPGPGTLLLAALDQWPRRDAGSASTRRKPRWPIARAQCRAARPRRPRRLPPRRLGRGARRALRPDPVQPALCRDRRRRCRADVADWEPAEALFAGADGLDDYRRLAPAARRACSRRAASPASKSAPGRKTRCARCSPPQGFTTASRKDLGGIDALPDPQRLIENNAFSLGFAARRGYIGRQGRGRPQHRMREGLTSPTPDGLVVLREAVSERWQESRLRRLASWVVQVKDGREGPGR